MEDSNKCLEVKASCLLVNIMYKAKKLKKTELYEVVENVCDEVGKQFTNSYCDNWGDSIPYMLECLEGIIKPEGEFFVYANEQRFNKGFINNTVMRMYPLKFKEKFPQIIENELSRIRT